MSVISAPEFEGESAKCPFCDELNAISELQPKSDTFCCVCCAFLHFDGSNFSIHEEFNTAQAAKVCRIAHQTIIRCFNNGSLKGYRASEKPNRRIARAALLNFMRENQIPLKSLGCR